MTKVIKTEELDFTKAMLELQDITDYLEGEDVKIDIAMQKYERGSLLAQQISDYLKTAENKITTIKSALK